MGNRAARRAHPGGIRKLADAAGPRERSGGLDEGREIVSGNAAYKAAQAKDGKALAALAGALDVSCTTCHKQYRPNVFPKDGVSK
jgi:hypothetical protein